MPKHGKRYRALESKVDREKQYTIDEAAALVKDIATAKFDETVDIAFQLGIDPRKGDQNVRGRSPCPTARAARCGRRDHQGRPRGRPRRRAPTSSAATS